ncbi:hypothetical protein [Pseudoalteromonas sp. Of7M-16]|uniref:hypothetical protein n=1 Tax=Pseudoalteromonas sp. Of7M-16 TaxID=2917756 RepID=UPI001EF71E9C|nr:hypothetical protein [Pseudoalteromonas sp. Of7M-16]MCG7551609.1 hypothetical protein [Pseudoalteromonas sp. Of7M-16]
MKIITELKSRLIAYVGGTGVSVSSLKSQASQQINASGVADILTWSVFSGVSFGSLLTIVGAVVVVCRFVFDVWMYFDQRKQKRRP